MTRRLAGVHRSGPVEILNSACRLTFSGNNTIMVFFQTNVNHKNYGYGIGN